MLFNFAFKHMDASQALKQYTQDKITTIVEKFATKPIDAQVTFAVDGHRYTAQCSLKGGDGFSLQVEHTCADMYGSVDRLLDKLAVQLKRKKDRLKGHKGTKNHRTMKYKDPQSIDYHNAEIDAADIIAFEQARRKAG